MTNTEQERKVFWRMFEDELKNQGNPFYIACRAQYATINRRSPSSDYCLSMDFLVQKSFLRVGVYIRDNVSAFEYMYSHRQQIESEMGFKPMWTFVGEKNPNTRRIELHIPFVPYSVRDYQRVIKIAIPYICKFIEVVPNYSLEDLFDY